MKVHLTKAVIKQALAARQRTQLWDTSIVGLYVEIRVNGRGSYLVRYTHPQTGKQTTTLGPVDVIKLEDARAKAREVLAQVYLGNDPAQAKQALKASLTLEEVVNQYYLPYIKVHKRSWQTDDSLIRTHILPALGAHTFVAITAEDIAKLHQAMALKKRAPATCNRVVVILRFMFNLALKQWKLSGLKTNPTQEVTLFKVHNQQQTFLTPEQLESLLEATRRCRKNPSLSYIVATLSLTGVRIRNVLDARWSDVDLERQLWVIPMTKSGKSQTIPLSNELLQLLQQLPSKGQSDYLFPSAFTGKPFRSIYESWDAARKKAGLSHVRIHDLRHTFASLLINSGHSLYVVQKSLGHHNPSVTMRYAHLADDTLKQASNAVGAMVKTSISNILQPS